MSLICDYKCNNLHDICNCFHKKFCEYFEESIFYDKPHNKAYQSSLKLEVVEDYLSRKVYQRDICDKYKIYSTSILRRWIKKHNSDIQLKDYRNTDEKYDVSYSQVYILVRKYDASAEDALIDKR